MSFKVAYVTLAAAVASGGTITVAYPDGTGAGSYADTAHHKMSALQTIFTAPTDFTVSFGASDITVTYNGTTTLPEGTRVGFQFDVVGEDAGGVVPVAGTRIASVVEIDLGAPDTADANGVCETQAVTASEEADLNGALVVNGEAVFDVPRNVVAAWTTSAVVTVTGEDVYGNVIVEASGSGTSLAGKKAFKKVTSVTFSANVTGATVGTGDVLGLPCRLPDSGYVLKELQDGAAASAGTLVAGITAKSTATTGDVRGTYDPNASCNGQLGFRLLAVVDPSDKGVPQFSG